jgi:hypothetical protein
MREGVDGGSGRRVAGSEGLGEAEREALRRELGGYLEGWGWRAQGSCDRVLAACLGRAEARLRRQPEAALAEVAISELERDLAAWAEFVLGRERIGDAPPLLLARVAFLACGGPERWPDGLLSWEPPAAMVDAIREAVPEPTPPEAQTVMAEQPFESWSLPGLLLPARLPAAGRA